MDCLLFLCLQRNICSDSLPISLLTLKAINDMVGYKLTYFFSIFPMFFCSFVSPFLPSFRLSTFYTQFNLLYCLFRPVCFALLFRGCSKDCDMPP